MQNIPFKYFLYLEGKGDSALHMSPSNFIIVIIIIIGFLSLL